MVSKRKGTKRTGTKRKGLKKGANKSICSYCGICKYKGGSKNEYQCSNKHRKIYKSHRHDHGVHFGGSKKRKRCRNATWKKKRRV